MAQRNEFDAVVHDASASDAAAVTPSDTAVLKHTRGLYIGVTGDVAVRMVSGSAATFVGVPAGALLPLRVDMVKATATTATNIVALY